jgi:hypothetical protein
MNAPRTGITVPMSRRCLYVVAFHLAKAARQALAVRDSHRRSTVLDAIARAIQCDKGVLQGYALS